MSQGYPSLTEREKEALRLILHGHDAKSMAAQREFRELLDASDWQASYALTDALFRQGNTLEVWTEASEEVRLSCGAAVACSLETAEILPTPQGYTVVKVRTDFADRTGMVETVTLVREADDWRIVGIFIE